MKKIFVTAVLCMLMAMPVQAAVIDPVDVNRQTFLNDITDSIATIGKDDYQKKHIKHQRHLKRKKARMGKVIEKNRRVQQSVSY